MAKILTINSGSSSVKYSVATEKGETIAKGIVERVGQGGSYIRHKYAGKEVKIDNDCPTHIDAVKLILDVLQKKEYGGISLGDITAVGHRVVHGGERFTGSALITDEMLNVIKEMSVLAPLHNPPNIAGIEAAMTVLPDVPQVAVFDTAFHQTMPPKAYIYALPYEWYEKFGVRRYGFHGTSHLYVSKRVYARLGRKNGNVITLHIGNGSSFCAVKDGKSVDTSMGFTPLEGAVMGTRCGDIDAAIPLFMIGKLSVTAKDMDSILNKKSGLLGITGKYIDRRDVLACNEERCRLAIDIECYRIKKYIGAYSAAMGGIDAVAFTAGVGENSPEMRAEALEGLSFMGIELDEARNNEGKGEREISREGSRVKVYVIPTDEERVIVEDTLAIVEGKYGKDFKYSFEA